GNTTGPGRGPTTFPGTTPNPNPTGQYPGQQAPIFLSGRVMLEDGSPPPQPVIIQRVCSGRPHNEGHTDSRGYFSIQLGASNVDALSDASNPGFGGVGAPGGPAGPGAPGLGGLGDDSLPSAGGTFGGYSGRALLDCELRADLPGFLSQTYSLALRKPLDDPNIGTILLHRISSEEGSTISATSLQAPKKARRALQKGVELARKGKFDESQSDLQKAVELYPRYAEAWCQLGQVQMAQKNTGAARKSFDQSIQADPKYVPPYIQISLLEYGARDWQGLAEISGKAMNLDPFDYPQAFFLNAIANYNLHNANAAEQSARQAQKLDTRHQIPQVSYLLGVILAERKDYTTAAQQLRDYLRFAPQAQDAAAVRAQLADIEKEAGPAAQPRP
ncbi:MAG TPA: tetratricopeptide repeat protein, partial [Bryobacteraceae bacterium]|nr:tetratricopeptide repeat protein [Bryobacteraceae bacterium]